MNAGRVELLRIESEVLKGNAPGDPHVRTVPVYLPPSYDDRPDRRFQLLVDAMSTPAVGWRTTWVPTVMLVDAGLPWKLPWQAPHHSP
mgnify:CR=1 FL=1